MQHLPMQSAFLLRLMQLAAEDYAATETIATLPRKLSLDGAPPGYTPQACDLAYYAPWGNLALFYKPFRHSPGLVRLGRIEGELAALRITGAVALRIEAIR